MTRPDGSREGTVQSVDRAISILEVIALHRSMRVVDISAELGLNKTTVFRLLTTMESRGMVEQNRDRGEWSLGFTATMLAASVTGRPDTAVLCRPFASELATHVGETVTISVLDGHDVVTVDQIAGRSSIGSIDWIGRRTPLHATAAGKILLAFLPADERAQLIPDPLPTFTEHTVVDRRLLDEQLETARKEGLAYTYGENEIGEVAVGAPIRRLDGRAVAAMTLAGPSYRVEDALPSMKSAVLDAASRASLKFGWSKGIGD